MDDKQTVRIFPLGGIGSVTKNLFVYEYRIDNQVQDTLIVDCGIGFPDETMYGVDLVIPDISYLRAQQSTIRGIVLTHAHDDHIGALPYVLPKLHVPVYASELTKSFVEHKLQEAKITATIHQIHESTQLQLGAFGVTPVHITHSVPDAHNFIITTPIGSFYHGSDFKFDFTPLNGNASNLGKIAWAGQRGVLCLLTDCLGSERPGYTLSERVIEETLEAEMRRCSGKFIFTTVSSNILRIQKMIEVAKRHHRKVSFIGRSIQNNIQIGKKLEYMHFSENDIIHDRSLHKYADDQICLIVAGSQGQGSSALSRIGNNEHKYVHIKEGDVVVFSADPIPGNETAVYGLIDILTRRGARVSYSEITEDLHVSGHGSQQDLRLMLALTKPQYVMPIGGTYRHMIAYKKLALEMEYHKKQVLIPEEGEVFEFSQTGKPRVVDTIKTEHIMVDGLGVGDVGNVVLRDRKTLANDGIVVIAVPVKKLQGTVVSEPRIISRGFIYMKGSEELVALMKQKVQMILRSKKGVLKNWKTIKRDIEKTIEKVIFKKTGRKPLILPVVIEV